MNKETKLCTIQKLTEIFYKQPTTTLTTIIRYRIRD